MRESLSVACSTAISSTLGSESDQLSEPRVEDCDWFAPLAWAVLGKDAGLHLHHATGWPESSCYAFVAKDPSKRRKINVTFLRVLFCSDVGEPFFLAFMEGCKAAWWREHQQARHDAELLDAIELKLQTRGGRAA